MNLNLGDTQLIIGECIKQGLDLWDTAYVLATSYHETAHTMKPVREYGGETYLKKKEYYPYVGMGYVQLTWDYNYKKASDFLGVDFLKNPKLLLEPKYAVIILVKGMKDGWFTGKKLSDYIDGVDEDDKEDLREFANARRIINGTDEQVEIGKIAIQYEMDLKRIWDKLGKSVQVVVDDPGVIHLEVPNPPVQPSKNGFWAFIIDMIVALFRKNK